MLAHPRQFTPESLLDVTLALLAEEGFDALSTEAIARRAGVNLDRETAIERAHEQFRWFGLGRKVNADLPNPDAFEGATQCVTPEQVAEQLSCGPDVEEHVEQFKPYLDAGFDEIAIVQIGAERQEQFITWAERELLPALRSLARDQVAA